MKKRKVAKENASNAVSVIRGACTLALVYLLVTLGFGVAAFFTEDPTGKLWIWSTLALLLSGAVGGVVAGKKYGFGALVCAAAVLAVILPLTVGILSGTAPGIKGIANAAIYLITASLAGKAITGSGKRRIRRR